VALYRVRQALGGVDFTASDFYRAVFVVQHSTRNWSLAFDQGGPSVAGTLRPDPGGATPASNWPRRGDRLVRVRDLHGAFELVAQLAEPSNVA
jgi:hypothetical protein